MTLSIQCHYADCHIFMCHPGCHNAVCCILYFYYYAQYHSTDCYISMLCATFFYVMLDVIMLSVVMPIVAASVYICHRKVSNLRAFSIKLLYYSN
jgi:hypothetical protein